MDIQIKRPDGSISRPAQEPEIRTMEKDRIALGGISVSSPKASLTAQDSSVSAAPPADLPVAAAGTAKEAVSDKKLSTEPASVEPVVAIEEGKKKLPIIWLVLAAVLVSGLAGFLGWWFYWKPSQETTAFHYECQNYQCLKLEGAGADNCLITKDCEALEPESPTSLVPVGQTLIIPIGFATSSLSVEEIKSGLDNAGSQQQGTFSRVLIKKDSPAQKEFVNFSTFVSLLNLTLPAAVLENMSSSTVSGDNYSLISYNQSGTFRLALILSIKEGSDMNALKEGLRTWESGALTDLKSLLLQSQISQAAASGFQDNVYQNLALRYINLPSPDLSLDYVIVGRKLLIATSKESALLLVDLLLAQDGENSGLGFIQSGNGLAN